MMSHNEPHSNYCKFPLTNCTCSKQKEHVPDIEGHMNHQEDIGKIRTFDSGATRDTAEGKHDFEGFLSPAVINRFGEYMTKHRKQSDGSLRDSDNWQKGIPQDQYMKSLLRHVHDMWLQHRGFEGQDDLEESICAILFNAQGYLHEKLKERKYMEKKK